MTDSNIQSDQELLYAEQLKAARRRSTWPLLIIVGLLIGVSFLTWKATWFGGALNDDEIGQYLTHTNKPRDIQHALNVLEGRIEANDPTVKRWYPEVVKQASSSQAEIRLMAAWVMGQDNKSEEFHNALVNLLKDDFPLVRRNAALALVRFNDSRGRAELVSMLRPYPITAPVAGMVTTAFQNDDSAGIGVLLASIRQDNGQDVEIRSPLKGEVRSLLKEGAKVAVGDQVMLLVADQETVTNALTALALIGESDDLPDIEHYITGDTGMPKRVKEQAARTAEAIRNRQNKPIVN